ncbi:hypothetical protein EAG_12820 [Camponotus floridanus]|uniref:Uncharacterized protein n=1 Tax=Camponotus floridanus TaxID=104421 RepID=E2AT36_CAMFO|nr:hypothetical protein EAG_12820 [Camponotus floridanus]
MWAHRALAYARRVFCRAAASGGSHAGKDDAIKEVHGQYNAMQTVGFYCFYFSPPDVMTTDVRSQYNKNGQFSEFDSSDINSTSMTCFAANTMITAEDSQCSSSCSTIVIVNTSTGRPSRIRRTSVTSSLELGYSHTTQNSAISSEIINFPDAIYDTCKKTDNAGSLWGPMA